MGLLNILEGFIALVSSMGDTELDELSSSVEARHDNMKLLMVAAARSEKAKRDAERDFLEEPWYNRATK